MSKNLAQINAVNSVTQINPTDLMYIVTTGTTDAAITGANLTALFAPAIGSTSITTLGTITTGTWSATLISPQFGGTGVNNGTSTITIGGNISFSGAFTFVGTLTGPTNVTFPTSGTLVNTTGTVSNATNIGITDDTTTNANMLPVWVTTNTGFLPAKVSSTKITFNPSTSTLTTTTFAGSLSGTATNATNVATTQVSNNASYFPLMVSSSTNSNQPCDLSTGMTYNPSTNALSLTGVLDLGSHKITSVSNGSNPNDAVNFSQLSSASSPLTTKGDLYTFTTVNARLAVGASDGQILQVSSAAATGLAWSTPTYPSASGTAGQILRSNGTNNLYSTATFADTYSASTILFSNGANTVAGLATANNGVLVTSNTGVPSILAGPGAAGKILQSNSAAAPSYSTPTYPSASGSAGKILISDGTNNVYSTPTYPNASATAGKILISDGTNFVASTPTYPNTSGSAGVILRSDGTNNVYTTATYPTTTTINQLLYSNAANAITGLSTVNSAFLNTTSGGVPQLSALTTLAQLANVFATIHIQTFTATGAYTYTPTTGILFALVIMQAAGAGGGGVASATAQSATASSGGAGACMWLFATAANIGASCTGSIGAHGAGGAAGANNGVSGGNTTFIINSSTWTAGGGVMGLACTASASPQNILGGAGGTNTTGANATLIINLPGKSGGYGTTATFGVQFTPFNLAGGDSFLGWGGIGASGSNTAITAGAVGTGKGSGGSGAVTNNTASNAAGGAGADGEVIVIEFCNQ